MVWNTGAERGPAAPPVGDSLALLAAAAGTVNETRREDDELGALATTHGLYAADQNWYTDTWHAGGARLGAWRDFFGDGSGAAGEVQDEVTAALDTLARDTAAWYTERYPMTEVVDAALIDREAIQTLWLRVRASTVRLRLAIMLLHVWRDHRQELLMPPDTYAFAAVEEMFENAMRRLGANMVLHNGEAAADTEVERHRQIRRDLAVPHQLIEEEIAAAAALLGESEAAERYFDRYTLRRISARARADEIAQARADGGGNPLRGPGGERVHRGVVDTRLVDVPDNSPVGTHILWLRRARNTWDEIAARLAVRRRARRTRSASTCFSPHLPSLTRARALALSLSLHAQRHRAAGTLRGVPRRDGAYGF